MSAKRLEAHRSLVIGGATGFGRAIAKRLAQEGADVLINYRTREEDATALREEIRSSGGRAFIEQCDVTDEGQVSRLFERVAQAGGVQSLVHCASAPLKDIRFRRTTWTDFARHWEVTVRSAFLLAQAFVAQKGGEARPESVVLTLSSVTLGSPPVGKSAYVTAKYGLLGLGRSLSVELAGKGIRVNCISPGFARTNLTDHVDERVVEVIEHAVPMGRICEPEDVAAAVAFLVSADGAYLTGLNIPITGGAVV